MRLLRLLRAHLRVDAPVRAAQGRMRDAQLTLREVERAQAGGGAYPPSWWTVPGLMAKLAAEGRLPRIAGATEKTTKESGSSNAAKTWTPEGAAAAGDVLTVKSPNNLLWNSTGVHAESLTAASGSTLRQSATLELGTESLPASLSILSISSGATLTETGNGITFRCTSASVATISMGGKAWNSVGTFLSGKYQLLEDLTINTTIGSPNKVEGSTELDLNGHAFVSGFIEVLATATVKGGTFKLSTAGAFLKIKSTATITGSPNVEYTSTTTPASERIFAGGGHTFGEATFVTFTKVEGNNTFAKLVVNNKEAAEGKGVQLAEGSKQTLTGVAPLTCNGAAEKLARLESTAGKAELEATGTGAGGAHEVKANGNYEPANSFIAAKGIKWAKGTLYLPNGKDEGGNENVVFSSEPAEHSHTLSVSQAQATSRTVVPARALATSETQSVTRTVQPSRTLAVGQSQAATRTSQLSRALAVSQSQAATVGRAVARIFTTTQSQAASRRVAVARTVGTTQSQGTVVSRVLARVLSVAQGQSVSRRAAITHALTAAQSQTVRRTVLIARSLKAIQNQLAEVLGVARVSVGEGVSISLASTRAVNIELVSTGAVTFELESTKGTAISLETT